MAFFQISSMVLGLLDQLQIFSQLCLIELLGLLTSHTGLLDKLKSYGIFGQIFDLSSFLSNRQPIMFLDGKVQ